MPVSDDVGQWLDDQGVGTLAPLVGPPGAADIFTEQLPDAPDAAILIRRTAGLNPFKVLNTPESAWDKPGIQVVVRGTPRDQTTVEARAELVRDTIDLMHGQTINGSRYMKVERLGDVNPMVEDKKFRREYTLNYVLWKVAT